MRRSRLSTIAALVTAGALALTACARNEEPTEPSEPGQSTDLTKPGIYEQEAPGDPTPGGTLTLADYAEVRSLDPTKTIATGYSGGSALVAVYDQLVRFNQRDQEFEYRLAESVEPNADHTQWTIKLREGVQFSDGTALNADAVLGSFNYYAENRGYDMGVIGPIWGGAEKVDDMTVQVNLTESWATFPFALGMGMGFIVAPAAIANGPDNFEPIGAGAFTLENYSPAEELVLAKNPTFWEGEAHLDKLRFVWLGPDETKRDSLDSGAVQAAIYRDIRIVTDSRENDTSGWVFTENLGNIIMVNRTDGRPGEDPRVSEAIAYAVDANAINDRLFDGLATPSKHLFAPTSAWYNEDTPAPEFDPEKATELVDAAKADGFDGALELTGNADPVTREQILTVQAQLEAVGFTITTDFSRTVADSTLKVFIEKNYDVAPRMAISVSDADPYWRLFSAYYSESASNAVGFSDPEYDELLVELRATEADDRGDVLQRIDAVFAEKLPAIPLAGNVNFNAWADNVHGITPSNDAMMGFEKAWISN